MAFCKYCGNELAENQLCDCEKAVASRQAAAIEAPAEGATSVPAAAVPVAEATPATETSAVVPVPAEEPRQTNETLNKVLDSMKKTWKVFLGVLKAPAKEGKTFINSNDNASAYALIVLQAIMASIFACVVIGKINKLIALGGSYLKAIEFSGFKAFLVTFLYSLVITVIMAGVTWLGFLLCKSSVNFKKVLRIMAVRSIAVLPVMILSILFFAIDVGFGTVVFVFSSVAGLNFISTIFSSVEELSANKKTYFMLVYIIVYALIFYFFATEGLSMYFPEALVTLIKQFGSLPEVLKSFSDFL